MYTQSIISQKFALLLLTTAVLFGAGAALFFPAHSDHPQHLLHISIHLTSIILGVFLTSLSIIAYRNYGNSRMLFASAAFGIFSFVQLLDLVIDPSDVTIFDLGEWGDVLMTAMISLFAVSVFRRQKFG